MELVSDRWYRDFGRALAGLSWLAFVLSAVGAFWLPFSPIAQKWGLDLFTLVGSALMILYVLVPHPYLLQRIGRFGTTLIMTFLFMLNLINLINQTGQFHSWYQILWVVLVFCSGLFGAYAILGFAFLTLLYGIVLITWPNSSFSFDLATVIAISSTFIASVVAVFFWNKQYLGQTRTQIDRLTGELSTNRLQSEVLINSLGDGIVLMGTDRKIQLINPTAAAMAEWEIKEATGIDVEAVMKLATEEGKPLDTALNPFSLALLHQSRVEQVLQLQSRSQKKTLTVSIVVTPVLSPKDKQLIGIVAVLRDVSTAHAEEKRSADFISTASHEMRTPVAAIEGYLALALNDKVSQIDSKARGYLEKAHSSTQSLGTLFQDLLTSAKAEDGRLVSHPVVVEMGAFIEQLADSLRFGAQKKGLLVDFSIGDDVSKPGEQVAGMKVIRPLYYSHVDPDRMREVITNLFDNAVKYTDTGKISIGLTGNNEVVQLYIRDTGPGIPPEDVPHLFQKFYRVDNTATRTIGGTGLGLFIARKIVELYKGRIWVESEVNKGSTFYINLPRLSSLQATSMQKTEPTDVLGAPTA